MELNGLQPMVWLRNVVGRLAAVVRAHGDLDILLQSVSSNVCNPCNDFATRRRHLQLTGVRIVPSLQQQNLRGKSCATQCVIQFNTIAIRKGNQKYYGRSGQGNGCQKNSFCSFRFFIQNPYWKFVKRFSLRTKKWYESKYADRYLLGCDLLTTTLTRRTTTTSNC